VRTRMPGGVAGDPRDCLGPLCRFLGHSWATQPSIDASCRGSRGCCGRRPTLLGARSRVVAKPTKHGDKWRVRWLDDHGKRQSAVFDDYKVAQTELRRQQVEVEQVHRGIRNASPPERSLSRELAIAARRGAENARQRSGAHPPHRPGQHDRAASPRRTPSITGSPAAFVRQ
jgi:hypothetical protein